MVILTSCKTPPFLQNLIKKQIRFHFWVVVTIFGIPILMPHTFGERITTKGTIPSYECVLNIEDDKFLDLVGSRKDMIQLRELIDKFSRKIGGENLSLGEILEYLKKLHNLDPNFFDVDAVRAIDSSKS
ncbi:MAG: hypothetical protein IPG53_07655 [Ignavibacteriales bacterium]|nr:hypothetical protein [Ignavibacteriales bacterium]